ncbi:alpha/beta hydrolase [Halobacteriales archaeon QS_8_69_26]|nr:MAG: alpha/beta hydrolase [Halobacteriales archaeon QS_8_69_26]
MAEDPAQAMYRYRTDTLVDDRGDGPALVCSHGTLMDRTMFAPQSEGLSDDYRVVAYDSRARTDRWSGPYDLSDLVEDCRAVLDALDIDSCVLAGMSMGGFMAARFALEYPERLDGLVLVDSMAEAYTEEEREEYGGLAEGVSGADRVPGEVAGMSADLMFSDRAHEEQSDLVQRWTNRWGTYPGDAVAAEIESWRTEPGVLDELEDVDVPALAVHGEEDQSIPPERARRTVERLPEGRMETIPGAGHPSNLERPEAVNEVLGEFLDEVYA